MGCRLNTKFLMNTCTPSSLPRYHTAWRRPKPIARPAEESTVVETEQKQSKNGETQFQRVFLMTACRRCISFLPKWQVDFSEKSRRPRSFHFQFWEVHFNNSTFVTSSWSTWWFTRWESDTRLPWQSRSICMKWCCFFQGPLWVDFFSPWFGRCEWPSAPATFIRKPCQIGSVVLWGHTAGLGGNAGATEGQLTGAMEKDL